MTTTILPVSDSNAFVRFAEPYVSDGLNKKLRGLVGSTGVVRGGRLVTAASGLNVTVEAESADGDSIYSYLDADGRQFTVRQVGNVTLNLTPVASTTVYVALYVEYVIGTPTLIEWRTYSEAELVTGPLVAEAAFVVVVGRVVVPAAGPIAASSVTPQGRRNAWEGLGRDGVPWAQVVRNPNWEVGAAGSDTLSIPHWSRVGVPTFNGTTITIGSAGGEAHQGERYLNVNAGAAVGVLNIDLRQDGYIPMSAGQYVRLSTWIRGVTWSGLATGTGAVIVEFLNSFFGSISTLSADFAARSGTFAYEEVSIVGQVPAAARWAKVYIRLNSNAATPSGRLLIDGVRLFVEPVGRASDDDQGADSIDSAVVRRLSLLEASPETVANANQTFDSNIIQLNNAGAGNLLVQRGLAASAEWSLLLAKCIIEAQQIQALGDDLLGASGGPETPRIQSSMDLADYALMWEMTALLGVTGTVRIYVSADALTTGGTLVIAVNAVYDNTLGEWSRDVAGDSCRFDINRTGTKAYVHRSADASPWNDATSSGNWDYEGGTFITSAGGVPGLEYTLKGRYAFGGTSDAFKSPASVKAAGTGTFSTSDTVNTRKIYISNLVKAWGRITTNSGGPPNGIALLDGFNLDALTINAGDAIVSFTANLANANYAVVFGNDNLGIAYQALNQAAGGFDIGAFDTTTGLSVDLGAATVGLSFAVIGRD